MITTVKMRLSVAAGAGGALRHLEFPPALVCVSLGSVIPGPAGGEAEHPASCMEQQEDRGIFQHPEGFSSTLLNTDDTWASLSSPSVSLPFLLPG